MLNKNYGLPLRFAQVVAERTFPGDAQRIYGQPMWDVRNVGVGSVKEFSDRTKARHEAGLPKNKIKYTGKLEVIYAEERVAHILKDHPEMTPDALNDIEENISALIFSKPSEWEKGKYTGPYHRKVYKAQVHGETHDYEVVLEFAPNGDVYLDTAYEIGHNKKTESNGSKRLSTHEGEDVVSDGHRVSVSTKTIQKVLDIVKAERYEQVAKPDLIVTHNITEEQSEIIRQNIKEIPHSDIPSNQISKEIRTSLSSKNPEGLLEDALQSMKAFGESAEDPLGKKVYFAPAEGETLEQYAAHLIAGHEEHIDDSSRSRALGVRLAKETVTNPMAIVVQENGRKKYLSVYSDGENHLHQIIVEVQPEENGRIVTSFVKDAKRKDKNAPLARFKNEIATSKKVLYIRGLDNRKGLSWHSRPPVEHWVSKLSAKLHPIGNSIVPQNEGEGKEKFFQSETGGDQQAKTESEETVILYHGSYEKLTNPIVYAGSMFNGMFFSADISEANGPGGANYYYAVEIPDKEILDSRRWPYDDAAFAAAEEEYGDDAGFMLDLMAGYTNVYKGEDAEAEARRILGMDTEDISKVSWEVQRRTSLLAEKLGAKAVAVIR